MASVNRRWGAVAGWLKIGRRDGAAERGGEPAAWGGAAGPYRVRQKQRRLRATLARESRARRQKPTSAPVVPFQVVNQGTAPARPNRTERMGSRTAPRDMISTRPRTPAAPVIDCRHDGKRSAFLCPLGWSTHATARASRVCSGVQGVPLLIGPAYSPAGDAQ